MILQHLISSSRRVLFSCSIVFFAAALLSPPVSRAYLIDFESVSDNSGLGVPVTNQFAALGVSFDNVTAITAGISLNELEFPPGSGQTVGSNLANGIMRLLFSIPVTDVAGYFTYNTPDVGLLLSAYDASDNLIGTVTSAFFNNLGDGLGDPSSAPNEQLKIFGVGAIARLEIDPNGGDFVLDDFEATPFAAVPEPGSFLLLAGGLMGLLARKRLRKTRKFL
jgi:hypothetical protein